MCKDVLPAAATLTLSEITPAAVHGAPVLCDLQLSQTSPYYSPSALPFNVTLIYAQCETPCRTADCD